MRRDAPEFTATQVNVSDGAHGLPAQYFIPSGERRSRRGLEAVLLSLRRWELEGDLVGYYLNLLEAYARLDVDSVRGDPALRRDCVDYLRAYFGRVHIGYADRRQCSYQLERLQAAQQEFQRARGIAQPPLVVEQQVVEARTTGT